MSAATSRYAKLAWGTLAFNVLVILWGGFVRATGSGAGCGNHWPLCNGVVVPRAPAVATMIEFSHRLTSGIAIMLIAALVIGAWRGFPRGHPVRRGAVLSAAFMISEALIGAGLVLLQLVADNPSLARGVWVAGHLVNTFLLVASLTLTAWWASGGGDLRLRDASGSRVVLMATLAGVLLLGVSGAVTALGDTLFPAATLTEAEAQTFSATAPLFVRLRVYHPTLAIAVGLGVLFTVLSVTTLRRGAATQRLAMILIALYAVQCAVGLLNVWFLAPVTIQIVHLFASDLIWITLVLFTASALADPISDQSRLTN
ncbi:MAG TPA: COX15/CtaA family protein [Candidatus Kryptonia bacterium]|nr:COX15/CtaA family protein [Candidatus Kryptonia bacterium]